MLSRKTDSRDASGTAEGSHAILYSISGCDQAMEAEHHQVRVSDVSDAMNLPRPGVTRTIKEMEMKGYLHKFASPEDGRVVYISLTEAGKELSRKYDQQYFDALSPYMEEISEEEANCMIQTIEKFYQIMCERKEGDHGYDK